MHSRLCKPAGQDYRSILAQPLWMTFMPDGSTSSHNHPSALQTAASTTRQVQETMLDKDSSSHAYCSKCNVA